MNRWALGACRKDVDDSELRKLHGRSFQVVGAVKKKIKLVKNNLKKLVKPCKRFQGQGHIQNGLLL